MRFYPADYLGDTRHLTTEQHGAYLLLLMCMWRASGSLPDDPAKLARMASMSSRRWDAISGPVMDLFRSENGAITQKRLTDELNFSVQKRKAKSFSGKLGVKAKSLKTHKVDIALANGSLKQSEPEPDIRKESTFLIVSEFESFWSAYPLKVAKMAGRKAYLAAVKNTPHEIIMEGVSRLTAEVRDPRFIPHASTWLNGQRWQDQIIERKPDGQSTGQDARQLARHENYRNALAGFEDAVAARRE